LGKSISGCPSLRASGIKLNIVSPEYCLENRDSGDFILVDVRRLIEYRAGHIPGALSMPFANFVRMRGLALYPPDEKDILGELSARGITRDKHVICYDNFYGRHACRALYTLELLGYERLSALSMTFDRYVQLGYEVEKRVNTPAKTSSEINARYNVDSMITKEKLLELINNEGDTVIIDTRDKNDYIFGHIPKAINLPWHEVVSEDGLFNIGRVLEFVQKNDIDKSRTVIFYCDEGTSSSLVMYAFRELGYMCSHTYLPSFSEWISYPELPVERKRS